MKELGIEDFWDMKSDCQIDPDYSDPLDEALLSISTSYTQIFRLCKEKLGSYIEVAYEWSWDEVMNMIEVLDVRDETQKRNNIRSEAEDKASTR